MARLTGWLAFVLASQTGIATGEVGESTTNLGRRLSENQIQGIIIVSALHMYGLSVFSTAIAMHSPLALPQI